MQLEIGMKRARSAHGTWIAVPAVIVSFEDERLRRGTYKILTYQYVHDKVKYTGNRDSFFSKKKWRFPTTVDGLRALPTVGDPITVYVNPYSPGESARTLEPLGEIEYSNERRICFGAVLLGALGAAFSVVGLRRTREGCWGQA